MMSQPELDRSTEICRKSFHLLGVILIPISRISPWWVVGLLAFVCLIYAWEEWWATRGRSIPLLSEIVRRAKRSTERHRVDPGPFFMAVGVSIPYIFFPLPVAHVALLQVCLADAAASLAGTYIATKESLPHSRRKTWVGSGSFWLVAYFCTGIYFPWWQAFIIASVGTFLESLPAKYVDNLTVPLGVALFIMIMGWGY